MKTANTIVMTIAGLMLLIASVLKSYQLVTEPIVSAGFWESWLFFVIQIPLEVGLGIWLVCGLFRKAAWLLGVLGFVVFMAVTVQKGLAGAESCGCFGPIQVNPWVTFAGIDLTLFLGLVIFRPKGEKLLPPPWPSAKHFFAVAIPTFILLPSMVLLLVFNKPPDKTESYVVVRPEQWTAKTEQQPVSPPGNTQQQPPQQPDTNTKAAQPDDRPAGTDANDIGKARAGKLGKVKEAWPMLDYIDIADQLSKGIFIVVFFRHDCPDCHDAIPIYDQFGRDLGTESELKFAFIEVPPFGPPEENPVPADTPCLTGILDPTVDWYNITTPFVVAIKDSSVLKYWQAEAPEPDKLLDAIFADN